jgi:outer membrane protein OmpA-like peptidoglycan-associated protein
MILCALGQAALAQDGLTSFSAQNYRTPIDSRTSSWTERTTTYSELSATGQLAGQYFVNPLVQSFSDGSREILLGNTVETAAMAAVHYRSIRLGVHAPFYLFADGSLVGAGGLGLGDLSLDVKINPLRDGDAPFGLAVSGRVVAPTATVDAPLRGSDWGGEVLALLDKQLDHVVLAGNVGLQLRPPVQVGNVALDDQLVFRAAASYLLDTEARAGVSLDLAGQANLNDLATADVPLEGMFGVWAPLVEGWRVNAGIGRGLTSGIGSPDLRVLLAVSVDPFPERDTDLDGLADQVDPCPTEAEDVDQRHDEDGCPDIETQLSIELQTPEGLPVPGVESLLVVGEAQETGKTEITAVVDPGTYKLSATAPGFAPLMADVKVPPQAELRVVHIMKPIPMPVTFRLTNLDGTPLDGEWSLDGRSWSPVVGGEARASLLVGAYTVFARSNGYAAGEQAFKVRPSAQNLVAVELGRRVALGSGRIDLNEVVKFSSGSATLLPVSYPLLDEVAQVMVGHPELTLVKVEGHTDDQGDDVFNLTLSGKRAASIVTYLAEHGVAAERLASEGFGETQPIASNDTAEGRAQNRRVEIRILERADVERNAVP